MSPSRAFRLRGFWFGVMLSLGLLVPYFGHAASATYTYDEAGRLKTALYEDGTSTSYSLDAAGNRKLVSATIAPPGAPGTPSVTAITQTTASVSWGAASGTVLSYEYSLNGGSTWTSVGAATTANLSGLTAVTAYTLQVHALNAGGTGAPSSAGFTTLPLPPGIPGVPAFSSITATAATATWTLASGTVTRYEYSLNGGSTWTGVGTALTANLTGLTAGTLYTLQVRAVNSGGAGAASSASFTTLPGPPGAPGVPTFTAITATTATASWTASTGTVTRYEYSLNGGSTWTSVATATSAALTGLTAVTTYTLMVHAVNTGGTGPASSASFTTTAYTDTAVITIGGALGPPGLGFNTASGLGSISPTQTTNARPYYSFIDHNFCAPMGGPCTQDATASLTGFSADPGIGWLTSAAIAGHSALTGASATYSYSAGKATWVWTNTNFGFGSGTVGITVIHK